MDDPPSEQPSTYTPAEVEAELRRLFTNDGDLLRLRKAAKWLLSFGVKGWEPDALVNEAIQRMLEGTRKWPRTVKLETFVTNVMRSIVDEVLGELDARPEDGEADLMGADDEGESPVDQAHAAGMAAGTLVLFKESAAAWEKRILEKFADDEVALGVLMGKLDGMKKQEILDLLNITSTQYESASKAIRRWAERGSLGKRARS